MYKYFSSQNCVSELLYVNGAIVTTPYPVKRCFCLIIYYCLVIILNESSGLNTFWHEDGY